MDCGDPLLHDDRAYNIIEYEYINLLSNTETAWQMSTKISVGRVPFVEDIELVGTRRGRSVSPIT